jgi:hypothetical protein
MVSGTIERFGEEEARDGRESCNPLGGELITTKNTILLGSDLKSVL